MLDVSPSGVGAVELVLLAFGVLVVALSEAGYGFLLGCSRFRQQMTIQMIVPWLCTPCFSWSSMQAPA